LPGLSARSEEILRQLDAASRAERRASLEKLAGIAERRLAMEEAKAIADALERRFGSPSPLYLRKQIERRGHELTTSVHKIRDIPLLVDSACRQELSRKY
jgi:hypothetical protein